LPQYLDVSGIDAPQLIQYFVVVRDDGEVCENCGAVAFATLTIGFLLISNIAAIIAAITTTAVPIASIGSNPSAIFGEIDWTLDVGALIVFGGTID
jgi:hypothetical protein